MASSRYACTRCQNVFLHEAGDAAFVDCPECGAAALPAGETSDGALVGALTGSRPPRSRPAPAEERTVVESMPGLTSSLTSGMRSDPDDEPGLFSGLVGGRARPLPSSSAKANPAGARGGIPPQAALGSSPSLGFDGDVSDEFQFQFPSESTAPSKAPPSAKGGADRSTSEEEQAEGAAPAGTPTPSAAARNAVHKETPSWSAMAEASASAALRPPFASPVPPAPNAADVAAATDQHDPLRALSSGAFGDLDRAFDSIAQRPTSLPASSTGLTPEEERFFRGNEAASEPSGSSSRPRPPRRTGASVAPASAAGGDAPSASSQTSSASGPPPRPPARRPTDDGPAGPPPRRGGGADGAELPPRPPTRKASEGSASVSRPRPRQGELSEEARDLAFLPAVPPPRNDDRSASVRRPARAPTRQETDPAMVAPPLERPKPKAKRPERPAPSAWRGLSAGRVVALVSVCAALGAVGGVMSAPPPPSTPRARAEQRLADGNRLFQAGRFSDAQVAFEGAARTDPSLAVAWRAQGAAFAKLERWDDAYASYEEYLRRDPQAKDAADVKSALARRGPPPVDASAPEPSAAPPAPADPSSTDPASPPPTDPASAPPAAPSPSGP